MSDTTQISDTTQTEAPEEGVQVDLNAEAGFAGAAAFADAESAEILNLLNNSGGGSCCGGSCCS